MQVNDGGYNPVDYEIAGGNFNVKKKVVVAESYPVIELIRDSINDDGDITVQFRSTSGQIIELILGDKHISYNQEILRSIQEAAGEVLYEPGTGEPLTGGGRKKSKRKESKRKKSKRKKSKRNKSKKR